jgi:predicted phosphodiesterase
MGDEETYARLVAEVDSDRHRFFAGNHDHYDHLPPHSLGDFGASTLGGVEFFFVRGAASTDREKLVRVGKEMGRTLWYPQEELTGDQMAVAEAEYQHARPRIVLTHDAPTEIARFALHHARRLGRPNPNARFEPSRTNVFLAGLLERHAPKVWLFGHHHRDWQHREADTLFLCVGELSCVDIDSEGAVRADPNGFSPT